jgi:hypothetical protein
MPRTHRLELAQIADWSNVAWALARACRGKREHPAVRRLLADADRALAEIGAALRAGRLPVGRFRAFEIRDPKRRLIHAAPLEDRVAHHALMRHMEPVLERALLPSVLACRVGKGVLFCGVHVKPRVLRASQRRRRRFRRALDRWQGEWLAGRIGDLALQRAHDAARAILLPADDVAWRRQCLRLGAQIDA